MVKSIIDRLEKGDKVSNLTAMFNTNNEVSIKDYSQLMDLLLWK